LDGSKASEKLSNPCSVLENEQIQKEAEAARDKNKIELEFEMTEQ
jgi:hypothetical protein